MKTVTNSGSDNLSFKAFVITGPDGPACSSDRFGCIVDAIFELPCDNNVGFPGGYRPEHIHEVFSRFSEGDGDALTATDYSVVFSTSAGNSEGWMLEIVIEDRGGFDGLLHRLQTMSFEGDCHVESPQRGAEKFFEKMGVRNRPSDEPRYPMQDQDIWS